MPLMHTCVGGTVSAFIQHGKQFYVVGMIALHSRAYQLDSAHLKQLLTNGLLADQWSFLTSILSTE